MSNYASQPNRMVRQNPVQWEQSRMILVQARAMLHWIRKQDPDRAATAARKAGHHARLFLVWQRSELATPPTAEIIRASHPSDVGERQDLRENRNDEAPSK